MGVAKAALESSVRYLAADMGAKKYSRERHFGGPIKRWRLQASATYRYILKWNETECAHGPQRHYRRRCKVRSLPAERSRNRRNRRGTPRRLRLSCSRHACAESAQQISDLLAGANLTK